MICYKCGHLRHKEDKCELFQSKDDPATKTMQREGGGDLRLNDGERSGVKQVGPEGSKTYGEWMIVSRTNRKVNSKGNLEVSKHSDKSKVNSRGKEIEKSTKDPNSKRRSKVQGHKVDQNCGSRFEVLDKEPMEVGDDEEKGEQVPGVVHNGLDPIEARDMNTDGVDNPVIIMETSAGLNPEEDGINLLETVSPIVGIVSSMQSCEEDSGGISLDKISLVPKDRNLEKSQQLNRNPIVSASKPQSVKGPKFKKSISRRPNSLRGVGKENRPVASFHPNKSFSEGSQIPSKVPLEGRDRQSRDPHIIGVQNSAIGGDVCGAAVRGPVCDNGPSDSQSSANGVQLLHPSGEQCAILDDDIGITLHNRRANESIEGDVPIINA